MKAQRSFGLIVIMACLLTGGLVLNHVMSFAAAKPAPPKSQPPVADPNAVVPATPCEIKSVSAVITAQLTAFKKGDYAKATAYQSNELRAQFGSVSKFRQMMTAGYPEFTDYKSVAFGRALAADSGQHISIDTTLTGEDGVVVHATYFMVWEGKQYLVGSVEGGLHFTAPEPTAPNVSVT